MAQDTDRQEKGFQLSTIIGTIFFTPVNMTALIYGFRYITPVTAVGTIVGELRNSRLGTIVGTVDVISVSPGGEIITPIGERPIARVPAGHHLVGLVITPTTGSIEGVVIYAYVPGRVEGA